MAYTVKKWYRIRRNQLVAITLIVTCTIYYDIFSNWSAIETDFDMARRHVETSLQEALKVDKGLGCEIPQLDPFAKEVMQFNKDLPPIQCIGKDWVKCWHSQCKVLPEILEKKEHIICLYRDILYASDEEYHLGRPVEVKDGDAYTLVDSDHAKVMCTVSHLGSGLPSNSTWIGHVAGFRNRVTLKNPLDWRKSTPNVLFLCYGSTSRNAFIRKMPNSYKYLVKEMKATILKGYNILGDGTPAALFPILAGKTEIELPDVRKETKKGGTLDGMPFIFYKLKEDGYRTAYFEDMPKIGTFQYRFHGFKKQPTDHYLRAFFLEEYLWHWSTGDRYCVGDTPRYELMMNLTDQFFRLDDKRFCFTFISEISHDDFNMIGSADNATVQLLKTFKETGRLKDTLLIVMGDHGTRYGNIRRTLQGKFEERLPLMAIVLPEDLKTKRPNAQKNLELNTNVLTTPHDVHATLLDALDWSQYWNSYKVPGADFTRGLTLLEPVPKNRSCSEAGIEPHWCTCMSWQNVSDDDPLYQKMAQALVDYINQITDEYRLLCSIRTLTSISCVMRQMANYHMMFDDREVYQVKIVVGPGEAVYEASLAYFKRENKFDVSVTDISRTDAYNDEPHCISASNPHLNMFCFCNH